MYSFAFDERANWKSAYWMHTIHVINLHKNSIKSTKSKTDKSIKPYWISQFQRIYLWNRFILIGIRKPCGYWSINIIRKYVYGKSNIIQMKERESERENCTVVICTFELTTLQATKLTAQILHTPILLNFFLEWIESCSLTQFVNVYLNLHHTVLRQVMQLCYSWSLAINM